MKNYRDLMHFVCLYTSGYFPIYDDEYERVHYDDNHHATHDTWGLLTSRRLTTDNQPHYDGSKGVQNAWGFTLVVGRVQGNTTHPILSGLEATPMKVLTLDPY